MPSFGSREWLALPDTSPAKVASCVVAAEAWSRDQDDLEERLTTEVAALRGAFLRDEDAEYAYRAAAHRSRYSNLSGNQSTLVRSRRAALVAEHPQLVGGSV